MARIEIIAKGVTAKGKPLPVGSIVEHPEAWRHCLPGFRNAPPVAKPADDETAALVKEKEKARNTRQAVERRNLQKAIDKLSAKLGLKDGQFDRTQTGKVRKATEAEQAMIDTAAEYGIHPTPPSI